MQLFVSYSFRAFAGSGARFGNCVIEADLPKTDLDLLSIEVSVKKKQHLEGGYLTILYYREM